MFSLTNILCSPFVIWHAVFAIASHFIRKYMQGGQFTKQTDETGKVVIVTGANTGIGKETALELARRGATVYMACRDKYRTELARVEIVLETKNKNVFFRELDLSSFDSIRKFVADFKKEQDKLHILINNAGVMRCPHTLTKEGYEMQLGVNHVGHFLLTNLLLDLLKTAKSGAQTTLFAALDPDLDQVSGLYFSDCNPKEVSEAARDDKSAKRLWEITEIWTNIQKLD